MSKKKNQKGGRIEAVPEHLRRFVESIVIREDLDDPKERARRALEKKRKQKEEEEAKLKQQNKIESFNEDEIKMLVKQFKMDFPSGNVNKPQAADVIKKVFPRYDADCLLKNIFEIFDTNAPGGRITNNDILWVFSMAMTGTADEKLQWLFKLYDKDQNGEIVQDEMEDIFIKMCRIVEKTEVDHMKKHAKIAEEERKRQAQALEKQREKELKKSKEDEYEDKNKVAVMYSERKKRLQSAGKKKKKKPKKKKNSEIQIIVTDTEVDEEEIQRQKDKIKKLKSVADELCQPHRDCKRFDPVKRAKEIFNALDANNDGTITEDEFVTGIIEVPLDV